MGKIGGLPPVTKKMTDESDEKKFQFTFYCDCCAAGFRTLEIPFSAANAPPRFKDFSGAQRLIWDAEHEDAYERGNREALIRLPACEDCGRHICEICNGEFAEDTLCPDCRGIRDMQNYNMGGI